MTNEQQTKPPLELRVVRGDENSISTGGRQFSLWPPGSAVLALVLVILIIAIILHQVTLGRLAEYEDQFQRQDQMMQSYRVKVMELETNLIKAQELVAKVAALAGVEFDYTPLSAARNNAGASLNIGASAGEGSYPRDLSVPHGLPLVGFVSQGYHGQEGEKFHPGVDIAIGEGAPVLATASGVVTFSGLDPTYGLTVIVKHNDTLSTLYGHNSKLLVAKNVPVMAGGRLALTGNTGRSTAPHLHYEVRLRGTAVDPAPFLGGAD